MVAATFTYEDRNPVSQSEGHQKNQTGRSTGRRHIWNQQDKNRNHTGGRGNRNRWIVFRIQTAQHRWQSPVAGHRVDYTRGGVNVGL